MHRIRLAVRLAGAAAFAALVIAAWPGQRGAHAGATDTPAGPVLDLGAIDPSCTACDDFARFATGGWQQRTTIPPGHASWGTFDELSQRNVETLHAIAEDAARAPDPMPGSDTQKIGTFYRACMDEGAIERSGTAPIDPLLRDISTIGEPDDLLREIGALQLEGVNDGLEFGSESDAKESSRTIASLGMGGTGLPDREYYLKGDDRTAKIRAAYRDYIATQLSNAGTSRSDAARGSEAVLALETVLAKAMPPRVELRDPEATYHPVDAARLPAFTGGARWETFFAVQGARRITTINVAVPAYVEAYQEAVATTPLDAWKAFLRFHVLDTYANALPKRFADARFAFRSGVLYGVKEPLPRWERCTMATESALRTPLGKAYVSRAFSPAAKVRAQRLVDNLQAVLHDDLATLGWMSPPTRARALEKLAELTKKIGYPDRWQSYAGLAIPQDAAYAALLRRVRTWNHALMVRRIGRPTDRTRWSLAPSAVNAYYNPHNNEIVFPAGILEPPFFGEAADDAVNYGAIGAVIGHEMTHGFDDQGRKYDGHGNVAGWWTPQDTAAFQRRGQCVADQFDALESLPGVHMNGKLVQGEAIADLGGTTLAFRAFQRTAQYRAHASIDGYTPEQRFFLAYAQVWRSLQNEAYTRRLAVIDPHPNDRLRVLGTLSNMVEFQTAFHCAANDPMVRKERCEIW